MGMKDATNSVAELPSQVVLDRGSTKSKRKDRVDGAMSPSIRELILSFGFADSDATWNADAFPSRCAA
jgi:hypothetical protein